MISRDSNIKGRRDERENKQDDPDQKHVTTEPHEAGASKESHGLCSNACSDEDLLCVRDSVWELRQDSRRRKGNGGSHSGNLWRTDGFT